jgi:hypothetical protein
MPSYDKVTSGSAPRVGQNPAQPPSVVSEFPILRRWNMLCRFGHGVAPDGIPILFFSV